LFKTRFSKNIDECPASTFISIVVSSLLSYIRKIHFHRGFHPGVVQTPNLPQENTMVYSNIGGFTPRKGIERKKK